MISTVMLLKNHIILFRHILLSKEKKAADTAHRKKNTLCAALAIAQDAIR
ncbi:MAG: hypothetical protein K5838_00885 [Elusimicrobiales bacterium]|nr:hypothetical protein [Elusimicrobiales bacterium]